MKSDKKYSEKGPAKVIPIAGSSRKSSQSTQGSTVHMATKHSQPAEGGREEIDEALAHLDEQGTQQKKRAA